MIRRAYAVAHEETVWVLVDVAQVEERHAVGSALRLLWVAHRDLEIDHPGVDRYFLAGELGSDLPCC